MADPFDDVTASLARADAAYEPIPTFADWVPEGLDLTAWDEARATLDERRAAADPDDVAAALQERLRAAAVDTGAIEGLYDTDRGFTLSVAQQAISLDQAEVEKGGGFRRHFEAQLEGFERALDAATAGTPISEAFIRHLHEVTCAGQEAYRVITPVGVQERRLALGTYKVDPNHVQLGDGSFHAYAPVGLVSDEMHRLVEQLRSPEFETAHPVVQAAYSHHAFTWIHPFPDGNGRVARLLASIWLLRAASIPLWIELGDKGVYLDALHDADLGDPRPFVAALSRLGEGHLAELRLQLDKVLRRQTAAMRTRVEEAAAALAAELRHQAVSVMPDRVTVWQPSDTQKLGLSEGLGVDLTQPIAVVRTDSGGAAWVVAAVTSSGRGEPSLILASGDREANTVSDPDLTERVNVNDVLPSISASLRRRLGLFVELASIGGRP